MIEKLAFPNDLCPSENSIYNPENTLEVTQIGQKILISRFGFSNFQTRRACPDFSGGEIIESEKMSPFQG
jgi:hypothetical protein